MSDVIRVFTEIVDDELPEVRVIEYSGRGMYGAKCFAITGPFDDCIMACMRAADRYREETDRDLLDEMGYRGPRQDSMGRSDVVLYWPGIEIEMDTCSECDGEGYLQYDEDDPAMDDETECPECQGSGRTVKA